VTNYFYQLVERMEKNEGEAKRIKEMLEAYAPTYSQNLKLYRDLIRTFPDSYSKAHHEFAHQYIKD
jgi:hypothetical protein